MPRRKRKGPDASRVLYQGAQDRLHVENFSPVKRQIVSDGTNFFVTPKAIPRAFRGRSCNWMRRCSFSSERYRGQPRITS